MEKDETKVSVIVPTFNGARKISILLNALLAQSRLPDQVIVLIDGSSDNTRDVVEPFKKRFSNFFCIENRNRGRAIARNCCVEYALGDLLIFYDDDMEPSPMSIARHVQFHSIHRGLLSGNSVEVPDPRRTDIQNYKARLTELWTAHLQVGISRLHEANLFFTTANCSIRKKDFVDLGGFNAQLTDAEDYELALRALRLGHAVYYDKTHQAIHHDNITCRSYIKRMRQYSKAHKQLQGIYPDLNRSPAKNGIIRSLVYRLFAFPVLVTLIDKEMLIYLPRFLRHKVYGFVIHALGVEYQNVRLQ